MPKLIRSLQILRFIAATMVVCAHAQVIARGLSSDPNGPMGTLAGLGSAGVDIFFLLSGAIIFLIAFGDRPMTATEFLRRRFERVVPIYWLLTLASVPFIGALEQPITWANVARSATFWPAQGDLEMPVLVVGWTLSFEMLFYSCATLVLLSQKFLPALAVSFMICWWARDVTNAPLFQFLGNPIILEFLLGVAIAWMWRGRSAPLWIAVSLLLIGAVGLVVFRLSSEQLRLVYTLNGSISSLRVTRWGIPSGLLLLGALAIERHLKGRWMTGPIFLGDASYSIYLTHVPFLFILTWMFRFAGVVGTYLAFSPVLIILALACGAAVHKHVEMPLLGALRRRRGVNRLATA